MPYVNYQTKITMTQDYKVLLNLILLWIVGISIVVAQGIVALYQYLPNHRGKNTPLYWAVNVNMMARNEKLIQAEGY